jgi:hypothetical protein
MPFFHDGVMLHSLAGAHISVFSRNDLAERGTWEYALAARYDARYNILLYIGTEAECYVAFGALTSWIELNHTIIYQHELEKLVKG